jgi:hypothetical protein
MVYCEVSCQISMINAQNIDRTIKSKQLQFNYCNLFYLILFLEYIILIYNYNLEIILMSCGPGVA